MYEFWETELTEEETERLLEKAAVQVRKRKLQVPAILALEMHKPLAFVGGMAGAFFAPFLVPMLGYENVNDFSRLLAKRENVERLLKKLEAAPDKKEEEAHA